MATHGIIAQKVGMTRMMDPEGQMIAVTLLQVTEQQVTKILTPERDGYHAIQVGYHAKRERLLNKADLTRLRKVNIASNFSQFKELRLEKAPDGVEVGKALTADILEGIKAVDVVGITKGKGFQGAIKRWGAARGRMTHGSCYHRRTGSLGMRTTPGRVFKSKHMPGHDGVVQRTIQNLRVVDIDKEQNLIALQGAVPGHKNGYLVLKPSIKA